MKRPKKKSRAPVPRRLRIEQETTAIKVALTVSLHLFGLIFAWLAAGRPQPDLTTMPYSMILELPLGGLRGLAEMLLRLIGSILSWRALRYLVMADLLALVPLLFGARFIQKFYSFTRFDLALSYLWDAMFDPALYYFDTREGELALHPEYMHGKGVSRVVTINKDGRLAPAGDEPRNLSAYWAGGPGRVVIPPEYAVQMERNGRLSYVAGPGVARLRRFEKVYKLIHLRHIVRRKTVKALTRDGIPVTVEIVVHSRIQSSSDASQQVLFPFDKGAIRRLTYSTLYTKKEFQKWEERPIGLSENVLNEVLSKYRLDELFEPLDEVADPHLVIQDEVRRKMNQLMRSTGIQVTDVWLGQFQLEPVVTSQYVAFWQSDWQRRATEMRADGDATQIREFGSARAQAQQLLIETLVAAFQSAQASGLGIDPKQLAALRLIDGLEAIYRQAGQASGDARWRLLPLNRLRQDVQPVPAETRPGEEKPGESTG